MSWTLETLAHALGVAHHGPADRTIDSASTLAAAQPHQLSFLANRAYTEQLTRTQAGAVIVHPDQLNACPTAALVSDNPYATWASALQLLNPSTDNEAGVHHTAVVDASADVAPSATIGPHSVVGAHCQIGPGAVVGPHSIIEDHAEIGANSHLVARVYVGSRCLLGQRVIAHPGVVMGGDGFGLAMTDGQWVKVPQLGRVVVGDDCEIGANTTIDRGALEDTVLGADVRIDNQVQIAHNVQIGDHTAIAGCVGIAGSTRIGAYCMIAGASGIGGHLTIADRVVITAMSTVVASIDQPGTYGSGIPAQPHQAWKRILVRLTRLDGWIQRLKKLEKNQSETR